MTEESLENRVGLAAAQFGVHGLNRPGRRCSGCGGCGLVIVRRTLTLGVAKLGVWRTLWTICGPCDGSGRWPA